MAAVTQVDNRLKLLTKNCHRTSGGWWLHPPANAGDTDSIPAPGTNIPRATGQLNPYTTTTIPHSRVCALLLLNPHTLEAMLLKATAVRSPCSATRVALAHRN